MHPTAIVDLSHPLCEAISCYPGDPGFKMTLAFAFPLGEGDQHDPHMVIRAHTLSLSTHTGTHIDAPFHFFPSGQKLHEIPLSHFIGRAVILDVRHLAQARGKIRWSDVIRTDGDAIKTALSSHIGPRADGKADIVLLWTGWDVHWGTPTYLAHPYFTRDVAITLSDLGAKIVGVDVLSPDETPADENVATEEGWGMHEVLLGRGLLICENLRGLGELVGEGEETWVGLMPLSLHDADAAPVRAFGWRV